MEFNFADELLEAIGKKGSPVCVGIDPVFDRLPEAYRQPTEDPLEELGGIGGFCRNVIEIVAPIVPAVKIQSAYFERYGSAGVELYFELTGLAQDNDLLVIGDVKRNDIGSTAQAYAAGHMMGLNTPDAITVNGYFGADGLAPFVDAARQAAKGIFVLVRTSNPSAAVIQDFADASGRKFYQHMAEQVAVLGDGVDLVGDSGYSSVGAVVGATYPDEARGLRKIMPRQIFLVPGYGAQGASASDCAAAFAADGRGAIVNASRSVIFAYREKACEGMDWKKAIESAAKAFAQDIRQAVEHKAG